MSTSEFHNYSNTALPSTARGLESIGRARLLDHDTSKLHTATEGNRVTKAPRGQVPHPAGAAMPAGSLRGNRADFARLPATVAKRIVIVDDQPLMRLALCDQLSRQPDFTVVGSIGDAGAAVSLTIRLHATVILLNLNSSEPSCFSAARHIRSLQPRIGVVLITPLLCDRHIDELVATRANGLLTTRATIDAVSEAVRTAAAGGTYFCAEVSSRIADQGTNRSPPAPPKSRGSLLTAREIEVLRYIASGLALKQIAARMHISIKTVDNHRTHLMKKLAIHDRVRLTRYAIREGLVGN